MKLLECYIENFGKLSDKTVKFTDELNAFIGDNGEGKTTLTMFIKAMLYGIGDTKKASLDENDRKHYLPWDGSRAGGSLTFSVGKGIYRIERTFGKKAADDTFKVYDERLGRETNGFGEGVGVQLFGIDVKGFERTVFLSERNLTPESDHTSITEKLSQLVGTDGNVGIIDEALELLDEQRKFYKKKGGAGQIADTRVELSRIDAKLREAEAAEVRLSENREKYERVRTECDKLSVKKGELAKRREALKLQGVKAGYTERVEAMRAELDTAVKRKGELVSFFAEGVPSFDELDNVKDKLRESKGLFSRAGESAADAEYKGLSEYFSTRITDEEVEEARGELLLAEAAQRRVPSSDEERARRAFSHSVPKVEDIERLGELTEKKIKKGAGLPFIILGILVALIGCGLGFMLSGTAYLLCAVGAALVIGGIVALVSRAAKTKKAELEIRQTLSKVGASELYLRMPPREAAEELVHLYGLLKDTYNPEKILLFLDKFDARGCTNPISYTRELLVKYERYKYLRAGREFRDEARRGELVRAEELRDEVELFLKKYKTLSDDPIGEIRDKLVEYSSLTDAIRSKRQDIASLSAYDTPSPESVSRDTEEGLRAEQTELDAAFNSYRREMAELEVQISSDSECVEERDELLSEKARLTDTVTEYEENFKTIQKTSEYLKRASENITSKYLGKTKEGFLKYSSLICKEAGEFDMDTAFAVSKREGAHSHSTESYSRGMRDMYRLAARLALIDSLYESETPFVILDDPFASFDDGKVKSALMLVERLARDKQILYFTCSRSRALDKSKKI